MKHFYCYRDNSLLAAISVLSLSFVEFQAAFCMSSNAMKHFLARYVAQSIISYTCLLPICVSCSVIGWYTIIVVVVFDTFS